MTVRPDLTREHYLDALALARATLHGDDEGAVSIANSCNVAMTFQAMTSLYLTAVAAAMAEAKPDQCPSAADVDAYLTKMQRLTAGVDQVQP